MSTNLIYILDNPRNKRLEFLMLEEVVPDSVEAPRKDVLIRNYRERPLEQGHWTHLVHPIFGPDDGLVTLHSVLMVRIEAMQTPDTHGHGPDMDEVWYMLEGNGIHVVSRNVYRQIPGDAVSAASSTQGIALSTTRMNRSRLSTLHVTSLKGMTMADKPHVLLISTDHWPNSLLGVSGHPAIQTPTLDSIARAGTRFTRGYSECPVCVPARKTLMTGATTRTHKDRVFNDQKGIDGLPTIAQTFRNAGYQAYAVGKLHVYPQRDRIGFDDVLLGEEGRLQYGVIDDYELFLGDKGYAGQQFAHGMCNNDYLNRPWHLPEDCHVTNWSTQQMVRMIKRRDPTRPGFWYLSYCHPHPPLAPLQCYMDMYRDIDVDTPYCGKWAKQGDDLPLPIKGRQKQNEHFNEDLVRSARQAFYALCTHIDHQLRVVVGTLREEGLLNNTILLFTSDHGDMLGNHRMWAKRLYYEDSANVPMLLVGVTGDERVGHHRVDDRLVGWQDVMPTLLHLTGIDIPDTVDGIPMIGNEKREWLYGECGEGGSATRMIHDGRFKLIYYATGNYRQLFDLEEDPRELNDLADSPAHAEILERLTNLLIGELYGSDEKWIQDGKLVGLPDREYRRSANRSLSGQRGLHWPPQPSVGR